MNNDPTKTATPAQLAMLALEYRATANAYQGKGNGVWYATAMAEARKYARLAVDTEARA